MDLKRLKSFTLPVTTIGNFLCSMNQSFIAISALLKKGILLKDFEADKDEDMFLSGGHLSSIQDIVFSHSNKFCLASSSKDAINIWHFKLEGNSSHSFVTLRKGLGSVNNLKFSYDDQHIAASISNKVWIIDVQTSELVANLVAENGEVLLLDYSPVIQNVLVTLFEDRTYGIWDLDSNQQVYQSSVVSSYSFLSLTMHPYQSHFAIGSSDGMLRVFDLTLHKTLHSINIEQILVKESDGMPSDDLSEEASILSLQYWNKELSGNEQKVRIANCEELYLVVACRRCVLVYNANSLELLLYFPFTELTASKSISRVSDVCCSPSWNYEVMYGMILDGSNIHVFQITCNSQDFAINLSLLSIEPLVENSPLRSEMILKEESKAVLKKAGTKKKTDKFNQPIVFNSKVSSSGYTRDKPRSKLFTPKINKPTKKLSTQNPVGPWGLACEPRKIAEDYPIEADPPINRIEDLRLTEKVTSIVDVNFSDSGKTLFCALSDHTVLTMKTDQMRNISSMTGHQGIVNSVSMGHTNSMLISASMDNTVKLWKPGLLDPILNISQCKHNLKQDQDNYQKNIKFTKGITKASFYFVDKFILLSHGNTLSLYKYFIDPTKDDIKRYQSNNKYKLVKDFEISNAQNITTYSAINSFYSYFTICACSNRDLMLFDMNKGEEIHTINDAHSRPVHSVCQNQGSSFVSLPKESYDLFITAAPCDGVKLWDLRIMKCARKFEGHVNRVQKVGLAFSPCSRYIAVGSEDRATYIYDVRSNSYLHRLSGHSETVSALAFNPKTPLLACGSLNGKLLCYTNQPG